MTDREKLLVQVFSPSAPIEQVDLFFGRVNQFYQVRDAISERGQHCVLFGERGVGKTSLANIIYRTLKGVMCIKVTCNRNDSFKGLWAKALSKVTFHTTETGVGFRPVLKKNPQQLDLFLPERTDITAVDLERVFENLGENILFIFDEFDSIADNDIKARFADTLKNLSDNSAHVTVLLVGIAEDVNDLIGNHPSLERCVRQVNMPRMNEGELGEIIDYGFNELELRIEHNVRSRVINFSSGFPHYTHLLSKYIADEAIKNDKRMADMNSFDFAVKMALSNAQQQIRNAFQKATISSKEVAHFENVLYAVATAQTDEFDSSTANEILTEFNKITKLGNSRESITYHLGTLCKPERGEILMEVGSSKNVKYKFRSPLMKSFVKLKYYRAC